MDMDHHQDILSAVEYFAKEEIPREKFVKEFRHKGYKLGEFLKVYDVELNKRKRSINFVKEGDMLLNFTAVFMKNVDEFYDKVVDFKQAIQNKWFNNNSKSEEHVDKKRGGKKKCEKSDFAFNFKSVVASLDTSQKSPIKLEVFNLEPLCMDHWKYARYSNLREDTPTFYGSYARGDSDEEPIKKCSMRMFDKFCEDIRPRRPVCILPCDHALVYHDTGAEHNSRIKTETTGLFNDGEVVPRRNTDESNGIFGDPNNCPIGPANISIEDAGVSLVDVSNDVDHGNVQSSFTGENSVEDDYSKELLRDIEQHKQRIRQNISKPIMDGRCPIALSPKDDEDITEDEINLIASKLKPTPLEETGVIKRCPIGINYELMIHNDVRKLYIKILQKRMALCKRKTFINIDTFMTGSQNYIDEPVMYESICYERRGPLLPVEPPIEEEDDPDVANEGPFDNSNIDNIFNSDSVDHNDESQEDEQDLIVDDSSSLKELQEWKEYLTPHLETLKASTAVNITAVKEETLKNLPSDNTVVPFQSTVRNLSQHEVAHKFMALLILINEGKVNVEPPEVEDEFNLSGPKIGRR